MIPKPLRRVLILQGVVADIPCEWLMKPQSGEESSLH
jgi:hypothetical protein